MAINLFKWQSFIRIRHFNYLLSSSIRWQIDDNYFYLFHRDPKRRKKRTNSNDPNRSLSFIRIEYFFFPSFVLILLMHHLCFPRNASLPRTRNREKKKRIQTSCSPHGPRILQAAHFFLHPFTVLHHQRNICTIYQSRRGTRTNASATDALSEEPEIKTNVVCTELAEVAAVKKKVRNKFMSITL